MSPAEIALRFIGAIVGELAKALSSDPLPSPAEFAAHVHAAVQAQNQSIIQDLGGNDDKHGGP